MNSPMNEISAILDHVRSVVAELGVAREFRVIAAELYDHRRRLEVFVRDDSEAAHNAVVRASVVSVLGKSNTTIHTIEAAGQVLDDVCDELRRIFPLKITPSEEQEKIVALLDSQDPPMIIRKEHSTFLAGNVDSAVPVFADKHGRLWREDANMLTLVYQPSTAP